MQAPVWLEVVVGLAAWLGLALLVGLLLGAMIRRAESQRVRGELREPGAAHPGDAAGRGAPAPVGDEAPPLPVPRGGGPRPVAGGER